MQEILDRGGAFESVDELKGRLVSSMADRTRRIESGEQVVVGVNRFTESTPSPLDGANNILKVDHTVEQQLVDDVAAWRKQRIDADVQQALSQLRSAATGKANLMDASIALAKAGGTTG
ncbi:MAG: protein meaA, partial [Gammaproteobacteria bacterium]|nr:protein meaA [Gammaproteobacteria bacterium]